MEGRWIPGAIVEDDEVLIGGEGDDDFDGRIDCNSVEFVSVAGGEVVAFVEKEIARGREEGLMLECEWKKNVLGMRGT